MAATGYAVYMRVRVRPEKRAEFIRLITELARNVRAHEPETLVYEFTQAADPNEFVFFERFASEAACQRHREMPYHVAMSEAGWSCLDGDPHVEALTSLTD